MSRWLADEHVQLTIDDAARGDRLDRLIDESRAVLGRALAYASEYEITGVIAAISGGNDSVVMSHLFREQVSHFLHANTQVGAEPTRQFVRDTAGRWAVPLLEESPPEGRGFEDLVLRGALSVSPRAKYPRVYQGGFPGPVDHRLIFGYLKGRAFRRVQARFNPRPREQRVIFMDARRASESAARNRAAALGKLAPLAVEGSQIRLSPMLNWTKLDLNDYRRRFPDVPRNETADLLHMSMECACGCYAQADEMVQIEMWLPSLAGYLHGLERRLRREAPDVDPRRLSWGWAKRGSCQSGLCNT